MTDLLVKAFTTTGSWVDYLWQYNSDYADYGLGYCLLPTFLDEELCPTLAIYNNLDLDNVNTLVLSYALIAGFLVFGGMQLSWKEFKLLVKDIEMYFAPESTEEPSDIQDA